MCGISPTLTRMQEQAGGLPSVLLPQHDSILIVETGGGGVYCLKKLIVHSFP
ncbi:MAG: hypothetical protein UY87_C0067G0004 [Candidatus Peribacteria bacterium GW2011_GWC2_54_8]|nr:MAG: hypothetical protein UY87_C0067G0004 [Candidatus Peribacteria bacterium GW2011_GWC2_54_8]KKW40087.1 MAG: hypothetical protein UY90_C0089G0003 [Candidatus Peregrinibacteria bacterium GW2011_GWA2_54_9]